MLCRALIACVATVHPDRSGHGPRPNQGDEKRPLSSNHPPWKRHPPLCHLACPGLPWDRSVPRFPTSQHSRLPRMRLSVEKGAQSLSTPPSSTGNLGERSGEISVLTTSPGNVFRGSNRWAFGPPKEMKNRVRLMEALPSGSYLPSRPVGPARQTSAQPGRAGISDRNILERRRCGTPPQDGNVFRQSVAEWRDLRFLLQFSRRL